MNNMQKQVKYALMFKKNGTILELGSGTGDFLKICSTLGLKAAGVDKHPRSDSEIGIIKEDIFAYLAKQKIAKYDGVYARHILEHLNKSKLIKLLKNINKVLKKGGLFIAILPNIKNIGVATKEFWKDKTHVRPYTAEDLKDIIKLAGLRFVESNNDKDSWDNSLLKILLRKTRALISGLKNEPPDYFLIAQKK